MDLPISKYLSVNQSIYLSIYLSEFLGGYTYRSLK